MDYKMKKILLIIAVVGMSILFSGCTNQSDARNALDNSGYTNVKITGYNFFACSKDDFYHTGFTAKNVNGKTVSGTVCSGILFKNSTVRF